MCASVYTHVCVHIYINVCASWLSIKTTGFPALEWTRYNSPQAVHPSLLSFTHIWAGGVPVLGPMLKSRAQQTFSVNTLGFVDAHVFVTTPQVCCRSAEAAIDNSWKNVCGRVPIKLYLQKRAVGRFGPWTAVGPSSSDAKSAYSQTLRLRELIHPFFSLKPVWDEFLSCELETALTDNIPVKRAGRGPALEACFSDLRMTPVTWRGRWNKYCWACLHQFWFSRSAVRPRICISNKLPGDIAAAGPRFEYWFFGGPFHGPLPAVPLPQSEDVCGVKGICVKEATLMICVCLLVWEALICTMSRPVLWSERMALEQPIWRPSNQLVLGLV